MAEWVSEGHADLGRSDMQTYCKAYTALYTVYTITQILIWKEVHSEYSLYADLFKPIEREMTYGQTV